VLFTNFVILIACSRLSWSLSVFDRTLLICFTSYMSYVTYVAVYHMNSYKVKRRISTDDKIYLSGTSLGIHSIVALFRCSGKLQAFCFISR